MVFGSLLPPPVPALIFFVELLLFVGTAFLTTGLTTLFCGLFVLLLFAVVVLDLEGITDIFEVITTGEGA
jgi:hypothetical protein